MGRASVPPLPVGWHGGSPHCNLSSRIVSRSFAAECLDPLGGGLGSRRGRKVRDDLPEVSRARPPSCPTSRGFVPGAATWRRAARFETAIRAASFSAAGVVWRLESDEVASGLASGLPDGFGSADGVFGPLVAGDASSFASTTSPAKASSNRLTREGAG